METGYDKIYDVIKLHFPLCPVSKGEENEMQYMHFYFFLMSKWGPALIHAEWLLKFAESGS